MDSVTNADLRGALLDIVVEVLLEHPAVSGLALRHRTKFEGWLKFAIAEKIKTTQGGMVSLADLEHRIIVGGKPKHVDLMLQAGPTPCYVELKTCNTSWACSDCEAHQRPIKNNIDGVIADRDALASIVSSGPTAVGFVLFTMFPVPTKRVDEFATFWGSNPDGTGTATGTATVAYHVNRIIHSGGWDGHWSELGYEVVEGGIDSCRILVFCLPVTSLGSA